MSGVFISYRRGDNAAAAGRLYDRLAAHFGKEQVFRDLDDFAPGAEFAKVIEERISQSNVLIAVIGKQWIDAKTAEGQRRLDDPKDYVKAEIREALNQGKFVIPVLIEGANVPKAELLPGDIAALAGRNALEISESRFDFDASRVIEAVAKAGVSRKTNGKSQSSPRQDWWTRISNETTQRTLQFIGGGIAAIVTAAGWIYVQWYSPRIGPPSKPEHTVITTPLLDRNLTNNIVSGRVIDDQGKPIPGATVKIVDTGEKTETLDGGRFSLSTSAGRPGEEIRLHIEKGELQSDIYFSVGVPSGEITLTKKQ